MSKKKKSAKKKVQSKLTSNTNDEVQAVEEESKIVNENDTSNSHTQDSSDLAQKKPEKEKVVEVRAKDVAKTQKKDKDKNKKPNKVAKALKDTGNELKRISWPPFKQVVKQTSVVLVFVIVFTVVLFGFDQLCIWLTSFLY